MELFNDIIAPIFLAILMVALGLGAIAALFLGMCWLFGTMVGTIAGSAALAFKLILGFL